VPSYLFSDARPASAAPSTAEAQGLIDDILALVELGLVWPVDEDGELRFAAVEDDDGPPAPLAA
jgi:hypothetical protein